MLDTEGVLGFVLDATNTGVWTWDIASDLVRWSPEAYRIHGMSPEEFGGTGAGEGGLGIGLALVKGLAELHGGTVEARSEGLGLGSEFIVRLPLAMPDSAAFPAPGHPVPIERPRRRVLIADDNEDATESLSMLLELAGHEVQVAHDGRSALSRAEAFQPEFAVLDIGMPHLNGYDVARRVREQPWGANIRLIALTGWGSNIDRQRTLEAGFDHHLTKPIDPDELQEIIARGAPD